ncbi:phage head-tail adapter protein [Deltaproteobacteria bacterium Smac51]|nr:phage head-tail adapter protein [Deltaproteobacteria bacterium Smac51]
MKEVTKMMDGDKIIKRFESLAAGRAEWEGLWQRCSDYVMPRSGLSNKTTQYMFDSTASLAIQRFGAAMESVLTPRSQKWHSLMTGFKELDQDPEVGYYLNSVRDILFTARYSPEANFANQMTEAYLSLGVHGLAVIYVDDEPGQGLRYQCLPVHEIYVAENSVGRIDTVFRLYKLTARQAAAEFENLPDEILRDAQDPSRMENKHEFIHAVFPRQDLYPGRARDFRSAGTAPVSPVNLPIASVHLARASRMVVRESGYRVMPYAVSRFTVAPGDVYGRSPAMDVMPDILQVNAMMKTIIRAAEKAVNPPLLVPEADILSAFSLKSGSINYGGVSQDGKQLVIPLQSGGNLPIGLELIEQGRTIINEAFFINLFQILVDTPQKTATEVVERAQEKAQLLAPVMGRQQSELLRVIIDRELDILAGSGAFAHLSCPPALTDSMSAPVLPRYETPMARAIDNQDGTAILNAFQAMAALAQFDSAILDIINYEEAGRTIWRAFAAPADVIRSKEEVALARQAASEAAEEAQQEEQAKQALAALPALIESGQSLAAAGDKLQGLEVNDD